jgi:hypothetical protein
MPPAIDAGRVGIGMIWLSLLLIFFQLRFNHAENQFAFFVVFFHRVFLPQHARYQIGII